MEEISNLKYVLDTKFNIKDLGNLKYFLEFEVAQSFQRITICQHKYSIDLLQETSLLSAKPSNTPMDPFHKL